MKPGGKSVRAPRYRPVSSRGKYPDRMLHNGRLQTARTRRGIIPSRDDRSYRTPSHVATIRAGEYSRSEYFRVAIPQDIRLTHSRKIRIFSGVLSGSWEKSVVITKPTSLESYHRFNPWNSDIALFRDTAPAQWIASLVLRYGDTSILPNRGNGVRDDSFVRPPIMLVGRVPVLCGQIV